MVNLLQLDAGEKVRAMLPVPEEKVAGHYLIMTTKNGVIKRTELSEFTNLRKSGLISRLWHPRITQIRLQTARGSLVKYSCAGRTVARHWPEIGRFECLKPFDLVIPRPDGGTEQDACRGCPNGQGEA